MKDVPFSFTTRFGAEPGTNPEELIAAAHAGCFSMALANYLTEKKHPPAEVRTQATISLEDERINRMLLHTEVRVEGLDSSQLKQLAAEAEQQCPVSNLLREGLQITLETSLLHC